MFLKISPKSKENTCTWNFIKKETPEFFEILENTHFKEHLEMTDSVVKFRSSQRRCSIKKGVLKNLQKFTGKHLRQSFFF